MVSVIGMTFLYDAKYSVVLLRPKHEVKLLTQSALGQICMEKWPVPSLGIFSSRSCGPFCNGIVNPNADTSVLLCRIERFEWIFPGGRGKKIIKTT